MTRYDRRKAIITALFPVSGSRVKQVPEKKAAVVSFAGLQWLDRLDGWSCSSCPATRRAGPRESGRFQSYELVNQSRNRMGLPVLWDNLVLTCCVTLVAAELTPKR